MNNNPPVTTIMSLQGHNLHKKCQRNDLKTEYKCLLKEFSPLPLEEVHPWEKWLLQCMKSFCWDLA